MAKQRQLNKSVIAGVTAAAMLAVIAGVGTWAFAASQRDPQLYVQRGTAAEKAGDLDKASGQFQRAFRADHNALHLVDAARCEYGRGEFIKCFGLLQQANAQSPGDAAVLKALLER